METHKIPHPLKPNPVLAGMLSELIDSDAPEKAYEFPFVKENPPYDPVQCMRRVEVSKFPGKWSRYVVISQDSVGGVKDPTYKSFVISLQGALLDCSHVHDVYGDAPAQKFDQDWHPFEQGDAEGVDALNAELMKIVRAAHNMRPGKPGLGR